MSQRQNQRPAQHRARRPRPAEIRRILPPGLGARGCRGRGRHHPSARHRPRASRHHACASGRAPALLGVHFSAPDRATVDALHAQAKAMGAKVSQAPGALEASAGGGYGFRVSTPEGHPIVISSDVAAAWRGDRRPLAADQAHPRRAQQRRSRKADRVLPRCARLQVERFDLHDGFRALLLGPPQRRVRARQRARRSTTWPTRCRTSTA